MVGTTTRAEQSIGLLSIRLSSPHKTIRDRRSFSTAIPLPSDLEVLLVSATNSDKSLTRDAQCLSPIAGPDRDVPSGHARRILSQLLRSE